MACLICLTAVSYAMSTKRDAPATACGQGEFQTPTGECTTDCGLIEGYYNDTTTSECEVCSLSCKTCTGPNIDECTSCPPGKILNYNKTTTGACIQECVESTDLAGCAECRAIIGDTRYCSKCNEGEMIPNGIGCAPPNGLCKIHTSGVCLECNEQAFLFMGGCYRTTTQPGAQICNVTENGRCAVCANGLGAIDGKCEQQCHPSCQTCGRPNDEIQCKTCRRGFYREDSNAEGKCVSCASGDRPDCIVCVPTNVADRQITCLIDDDTVSDPVTCKLSIAKCKVCESATICKVCELGYELTSLGNMCYFGANPEVCQDIIQHCWKCKTAETCLECSEGYDLQKGGKECVELADPTICRSFVPQCETCANSSVCSVCKTGFFRTSSGKCTNNCTNVRSYSSGSNCIPCADDCKTCDGPGTASCTSCPVGKRLEYSVGKGTGECVNECIIENGFTGCAICGASIAGTAYCSQCNDKSQAPLNGVCVSNAAKIQFCKAAKDGKCIRCSNDYFLYQDGCYNATRQPGEEVCQLAANGLCTKCANGLAAISGDCSSQKCHTSCNTCSSTSSQDCESCASGYYKEIAGKGRCTKCSAAMSNCSLCVYMNQQFACIEVTISRQSKLGTGEIVGITVGVSLIIGGLIGLLCWLFLCKRGEQVKPVHPLNQTLDST